jgi:hypothetical protein
MALCNIAGIGGGGVVIPFCMTFFVFDTKSAISLSGFTILCSSVMRFFFNFRQKHPEKDQVVIDYNIATVMLPTVITGSMLGVLINVITPSFILLLLLTCLLLGLAV